MFAVCLRIFSQWKEWFRVEEEGGKRDARVDTMRGFFLMLMIVDHLGGVVSKYITWQPFGWVSAAEGFVFLSGAVFAYVQRKRVENVEQLCLVSWQRAWQLYCWFVGIIVLVVLVPSPGLWLHQGMMQGNWSVPIPLFWQQLEGGISWDFLWSNSLVAPLFLQRPGNILPLYVWFLLFAPCLLVLLQFRKITLVVLLGSLVLWAIGLRVDVQNLVSQQLFGRSFAASSFPLLSWQIFFVFGMWAGTRWGKGILPSWLRGRLVTVLLVLVALFFFTHRHVLSYKLFLFMGGDWVWENWTRVIVHPMRLFNAFVLAVLLKRLWEWVSKEFGLGFLAVMGRHSLVIFSVQAAILMWYKPWRKGFESASLSWQILLSFAVVAVFVWLARCLDARKKKKLALR